MLILALFPLFTFGPDLREWLDCWRPTSSERGETCQENKQF